MSSKLSDKIKKNIKLSGANDIIVIEQKDGTFKSSEFNVRFGKINDLKPGVNDSVKIFVNQIECKGCNDKIFVNDSGEVYFSSREIKKKDSISNDLNNVQSNMKKSNSHNNIIVFKYSKDSDSVDSNLNNQDNTESSISTNSNMKKKLSEKLFTSQLKTESIEEAKLNQKPDSEFLKLLNLNFVKNVIIFQINTDNLYIKEIKANIFKWKYDDKIVLSDIDGTITKSDVRGHIYTIIGKDWFHENVASLFYKIKENGYKIVYLSARSVLLADKTRSVLKEMRQNDHQMPDGPVILNPVNIMDAIHTELISKNPDEFKTNCLNGLKSIFQNEYLNPFFAGFGNKMTDILAYKNIGIDFKYIFIINETGLVLNSQLINDQSTSVNFKSINNLNNSEKNDNSTSEKIIDSDELSYLKLSNLVHDYFPMCNC